MLNSITQLFWKSNGRCLQHEEQYPQRNIEELIDKYRDAHILDSGWREVDTEEWVA